MMNALTLSIIGAIALVILLRVLKLSWPVVIIAALVLLVGVNIEWVKPSLENIGRSLGTNTVLGIAAIVMLALLFLKVPVFISVFGGSLIYFLFNPGINQIIFGQKAVTGTESPSLLAIPFFVCAGTFMNYSGVTT